MAVLNRSNGWELRWVWQTSYEPLFHLVRNAFSWQFLILTFLFTKQVSAYQPTTFTHFMNNSIYPNKILWFQEKKIYFKCIRWACLIYCMHSCIWNSDVLGSLKVKSAYDDMNIKSDNECKALGIHRKTFFVLRF